VGVKVDFNTIELDTASGDVVLCRAVGLH